MARKPTPIQVSSIRIGFRSDDDLVISKEIGTDIIKWGKNNLYPSYLLSLYKGQPQHKGIVRDKAKYLSGIDLTANTPIGTEWLENANPKESWYDISKKFNKDFTLYGARAIKIVPNTIGIPLWFFHMDFGKCRMSICETKIYYCDDWTKKYECGIQEYPIWYEGCNEVSIYLYKNYNQTTKKIEAAYPELEYDAAIKDIDTLKRIQNSRNSLVINDFSAGTVCVIKGGKPDTKEEARILVDKIKGTYTGDEKTGNIPVVFTDPGNDSGVEFSTVPTNGLDKKYIEVTSAATKNVFAAHNVPADLFNYIADSTPLFDKQKLVDQNELFMNSYVLPEQEPILDLLEEMFSLRYPGQICDFEIEQFNPIGLDLPLENQAVVTALNAIDTNIIPAWLDRKYKLNLPKTAQGETAPVNQTVNDHLKNLTGKQTQGIMRIVRKFQNGEYSQQQAKLLLKSGFGLTDQECNEFLGITPQAVPIAQRLAFAQQDKWIQTLRKHKITIPDGDEIIETKFVNDFASPLSGSITDILEKIVGSRPKKKDGEEKTVEYYTVFTYGLRDGVQGPVIMPTTRDWCRKTYAEFKNVRDAITLEAIEEMTNDFGMNAFDYRGGFYNDGTETTPYCRHIWRAHTVAKKV